MLGDSSRGRVRFTPLLPGPIQFVVFSGSSLLNVLFFFFFSSALANAPQLVNAVAVVERGVVAAVDKARRVQAAGAVGCIIVNSNDKAWRPGGHLLAGAATADVDDIDIPVVVVPISIRHFFKDRIDVSISY